MRMFVGMTLIRVEHCMCVFVCIKNGARGLEAITDGHFIAFNIVVALGTVSLYCFTIN